MFQVKYKVVLEVVDELVVIVLDQVLVQALVSGWDKE
jgi:hypothetical protein